MVGILVLGNNHLIVRGPLPDRTTALALARHWSIIQIGRITPDSLRPWSISTKEFREDLAWAVVVPGDGEMTSGVTQLLDEITARGVKVQHSYNEDW
jgi:hypothetical protein